PAVDRRQAGHPPAWRSRAALQPAGHRLRAPPGRRAVGQPEDRRGPRGHPERRRPRGRDPLRPDAASREGVMSAPAMSVPESRVLVVDDEEGPREAIRMIRKPRYQVYLAGSGEEVLDSLPTLRPDVIFMDVKMPRIDGVQLLERVKAVDPLVEVVMITAYAS